MNSSQLPAHQGKTAITLFGGRYSGSSHLITTCAGKEVDVVQLQGLHAQGALQGQKGQSLNTKKTHNCKKILDMIVFEECAVWTFVIFLFYPSVLGPSMGASSFFHTSLCNGNTPSPPPWVSSWTSCTSGNLRPDESSAVQKKLEKPFPFAVHCIPSTPVPGFSKTRCPLCENAEKRVKATTRVRKGQGQPPVLLTSVCSSPTDIVTVMVMV